MPHALKYLFILFIKLFKAAEKTANARLRAQREVLPLVVR